MRFLFPLAYTATAVLGYGTSAAYAQTSDSAATAATVATPSSAVTAQTVLPTINVSADASANGLSPAFAGGQVAHGGRNGILGTVDNMSSPFSLTSFTNDLIQDKQAKSVGEVLQNDPGVRIARGFGNFQESYYIRGFLLSSDDVSYNGLYSLLPRQYIATELFERVEVLRGASAFLNGASPGGDGLGGAVNLVPKRAGNEPLTRITLAGGSGGHGSAAVDLSRRFGVDDAAGVRLNVAKQAGGTGIDDERNQVTVGSLAFDWHSQSTRLSADIGYQENRLSQTRPNVTLSGLTAVPSAPDASRNFAQPWSFSNERDVFGTLRGEWDLDSHTTVWAAYGFRRSSESNSLANLTVSGADGSGSFYRFDNTRQDQVDTGELGIRSKFRTGSVGHEVVASLQQFDFNEKAAYEFDFSNQFSTSLYSPVSYAQPTFSATANAFGSGNILAAPALVARTKLTSVALADTLSLLNDSLLITPGVRLQRLDVSTFSYSTPTSAGGAETNYNDTRFSPMAAIVYKFNPQFSVYANYIEGLSKGDIAPLPFSGPAPANVGQALAPYVTKQKEVGIKYDGGRIGAGLAFFSTTKPRSYTSSSNVFVADGEDRHRGIELNVFGEAAKGVRVLGGLTWLNAVQQSTGSATTDGKRVIGVPRYQANFGVDADVPGVAGLALNARVVYTGASYADAVNTLRVPGWTRLDLGARWLMPIQGKAVTFRLKVDNVTNKNYWASVGGYPDNGYLVAGAPRTVVGSVSIDF